MSTDQVKDTRGGGSERGLRHGLCLGFVLLLGTFASGTGCWATEADASDSMAVGEPAGCPSNANQGDFCTADCSTTCGNGAGTKYCRCEGGVFTQCPCLAPPNWAGAEEAPYCDTQSGATSAIVGNGCPDSLGVECVGAEPDHNTHVIMQCSCENRPSAVDPSIVLPIWGCLPAGEVTGLPTCESLGTGLILPPTSLKDRTCPVEWETCVGRDYDRNTETPKGCFCEKQVDDSLKWNCGSTNKWFRPIDP